MKLCEMHTYYDMLLYYVCMMVFRIIVEMQLLDVDPYEVGIAIQIIYMLCYY